MLWAKKYFKLWTQNELVNGIIQKNTNLICFFGTEKGLSIIQYSTYMREFSPLDFYIFCTILPHFSVLHVEHKLLVKFFFLKSSSSGLCFLYYENWGGFCSERISKLITWWTFFSLLGWTHTCPINHVRYCK